MAEPPLYWLNRPAATAGRTRRRKRSNQARSLVCLALVAAVIAVPSPAPAQESSSAWKSLRLEPDGIVLAGPGLSQRFLVAAVGRQGDEAEVTGECEIVSSNPAVVAVDSAENRFVARAPGRSRIRVRLGDLAVESEVRVGSSASEMAVSFAPDIVSILTLKGCNGSSCHGSPAGQNGFKLSLFGYDIAADHEMIVSAHEGRRVDLARPEESLLLRKPTFEVPHGGGRLLSIDSEEYEAILGWLRQGASFDTRGAQLERLELHPGKRVLVGSGAEQRLVAIGRLSDGSTRDMTDEVRYFSASEAVAELSPQGTLTAGGPGLTTVTARAMGKVATAQFGVVDALAGADYRTPPPNNLIDEAVFGKLRQMNVRPSGLSSDREFVRRVYLDAIGLLPTARELRAFLKDPRPDKRSRLIDALLERPEHASHWTVRFEDWFRNCQLHSQGRSMGVFKDWVRDWLGDDRPYDDFVRTLLTSRGDTMLNPGANFWHPATDFMLKEFSVAKVTPDRVATLPRGPHGVRGVPQPPPGELHTGRLLRPCGVLRPASRQARLRRIPDAPGTWTTRERPSIRSRRNRLHPGFSEGPPPRSPTGRTGAQSWPTGLSRPGTPTFREPQ